MTAVPSQRRSAPRPDDPELHGRRSERRAYLVLPASAEALSGHLRVTLLDVSVAGARLAGSSLPAAGKEMILRCGGIDTFGTIIWSEDGGCGIQFDEPISLQDLLALRAMFDAAKRSKVSDEERQAAADWVNGIAR